MADLETEMRRERLFHEIDLYLEAVDTFRALSCEPTWKLELPPRRPRPGQRVVVPDTTTTSRRPVPPPRFTV
jgi:hypothetical protein